MTPPIAVSPNQGDARRPPAQSAVHKLIMTPVIFVTFLVSLALVDLRYSVLRAHYHPDDQPHGRMPAWLHRIIYRYRPYRYQNVNDKGRPVGKTPASPSSPPWSGRQGEDYYHSKQRKLMKMEAEEAFEMRGTVVVVLGVVSLTVAWAAWKMVAWVAMTILFPIYGP
ncbi:hypothetical protein VTJ83DRAFT_2119 [Remersonia thermophila]|uniref:Uncharacterized protein n=1 Tax=Remersonia thermophila TaxID=72144 RepID=A0ABR4DHY1_9PEZI